MKFNAAKRSDYIDKRHNVVPATDLTDLFQRRHGAARGLDMNDREKFDVGVSGRNFFDHLWCWDLTESCLHLDDLRSVTSEPVTHSLAVGTVRQVDYLHSGPNDSHDSRFKPEDGLALHENNVVFSSVHLSD